MPSAKVPGDRYPLIQLNASGKRQVALVTPATGLLREAADCVPFPLVPKLQLGYAPPRSSASLHQNRPDTVPDR